MIMGVAFAVVMAIVAMANNTLILVGRVTLAVAEETAVVPANGVLLTALDAPVTGSSMTCTTMPGGMFDPSRKTSTGLVCGAGTTISGTFCNEPRGDVEAELPATEAMRKDSAIGRSARQARRGA